MSGFRISWQAALALILCAIAAAKLPIAGNEGAEPFGPGATAAVFALIGAAALLSMLPLSSALAAAVLFVGAHGAAWLLIAGIAGSEGAAHGSFFLLAGAAWLLAWRCVTVLSAMRPKNRAAGTFLRLLIPTIFGAWILILWEAVTRGAGIPDGAWLHRGRVRAPAAVAVGGGATAAARANGERNRAGGGILRSEPLHHLLPQSVGADAGGLPRGARRFQTPRVAGQVWSIQRKGALQALTALAMVPWSR